MAVSINLKRQSSIKINEKLTIKTNINSKLINLGQESEA